MTPEVPTCIPERPGNPLGGGGGGGGGGRRGGPGVLDFNASVPSPPENIGKLIP